jgi:hypothetical protein
MIIEITVTPKVTPKNYCHRFAMESVKECFPPNKELKDNFQIYEKNPKSVSGNRVSGVIVRVFFLKTSF